MNLTSQEQEALYRSKLIEGKSGIEAGREVRADMKFLKDFDNIKKEKQLEINQLEKVRLNLLKQVEKVRKNLFNVRNQALKSISSPKTYIDERIPNGKYATTIILSRVLHYTERNKFSLLESKKLAQSLGISKSQALDSLQFIKRWIR